MVVAKTNTLFVIGKYDSEMVDSTGGNQNVGDVSAAVAFCAAVLKKTDSSSSQHHQEHNHQWAKTCRAKWEDKCNSNNNRCISKCTNKISEEVACHQIINTGNSRDFNKIQEWVEFKVLTSQLEVNKVLLKTTADSIVFTLEICHPKLLILICINSLILEDINLQEPR